VGSGMNFASAVSFTDSGYTYFMCATSFSFTLVCIMNF